MKYIKSILKLGLAVIASLLILSSCEDFLEQPLQSITTADSVFSNPDNAMLALWAVYQDGMTWNHGLRASANTVTGYPPEGGTSTFGYGGNSQVFHFSDESTHESCSWGTSIQFVFGTWNSFGQREFPIIAVVNAIRTCNIFLENADKVPVMQTPTWNWTEDFRDQVKAEARFMRAFLHFEFFRRYGGIPIMDRMSSFGPKEGGGIVVEPNGERKSIASVIDFIVNDCDLAIPDLPDSYSTAETGRVNKGAALALKAKALLYAASPLYNSATPPVPYGDGRDSLLCYGDEDNTRWQKAADAYEDAITWAEANGYQLLDDPVIGKRESYVYACATPRSQSPKNKEAIFWEQGTTSGGIAGQWYFAGGPLAGANYARSGVGVNFVRNNYRDKNGITLNIPDAGTFPQLKGILRKAEPRFHASVWAPGFQYSYFFTSQYNNWGAYDTSKFSYHKADGSLLLARTSGAQWSGEPMGFFYAKKWRQFSTQYPQKLNWIEFRLAELYLGYAEAANEVDPDDVTILTQLNKIRVRGGLPLLQAGDPTYDAKFGDKVLMREEIRRERSVEHFGEEHRYFDVRRWKIATDVMGGQWKYIYIYENGTGTYTNPLASWTPAQRYANDSKLSYEFRVLSTHVWEDKMYFYPWYQSEVNKGTIIQNPGW